MLDLGRDRPLALEARAERLVVSQLIVRQLNGSWDQPGYDYA